MLVHAASLLSSFPLPRHERGKIAKRRIGVLNAAFTKSAGAGVRDLALGGAMEGPPNPRPQAGGSILAAAIITGVVGGIIAGQPSIGFLVGTGIGVTIAVILWLRDRRR